MSLVWQCDRCYVPNRNGDVDDPPEGWREYDLPVRGSEGARSVERWTLCNSCEDSLYEWMREPSPLYPPDFGRMKKTS